MNALTFLIRAFLAPCLPLYMGGGGGDGGAAEARRAEEERQARINAAVNEINGIFDGKQVAKGVGAVNALKPGSVYYAADGTPVRVPESATKTQTVRGPWRSVDNGGPRSVTTTVPDEDYINAQKLLASGQLFSGRQESMVGGGRDALYNEQKQAIFDLNKQEIDKQFAEAERQNRFGLARSGLMGGSADVDSNAQIQERTNQGLLQASALGDAAAAELKTADERSRQSLISLAQTGVDAGTAQNMALQQLNASAQTAKGNRTGAQIGNLFGDLSQAYLNRQVANGQMSGRNQFGGQNYGVSNPRAGDSGMIN